MSGKDDELNKNLLDHEYDGIREQDNPLPRWWLATFYITIVFGAFYYAYYEIGTGPTVAQELQREQALEEIARLSTPRSALPSDEDVMSATRDGALMASGKTVFAGRCASCHGLEGGGGIGPNLTDHFWIHGGKPGQIAVTVARGVLDKGMPAWEALLKPEETLAVTAFVVSLKGKNVAGANKGPQGVEEK